MGSGWRACIKLGQGGGRVVLSCDNGRVTAEQLILVSLHQIVISLLVLPITGERRWGSRGHVVRKGQVRDVPAKNKKRRGRASGLCSLF